MLKITSKEDGFRRCGIEHPAIPTLHEDDAFTDEQLEILMNEPMLIVDVLEDKHKPDQELRGENTPEGEKEVDETPATGEKREEQENPEAKEKPKTKAAKSSENDEDK